MQVCSNFKRICCSLQELLGIKRRKQVNISAPYNFKKETTVIPGVTEEELEAYRDEAAAFHLDPLGQHSPSSSRSRRGVDRNNNKNKNNKTNKSHNQLRSSSLANLTVLESTTTTTTTITTTTTTKPTSSSNNRKQLLISKSCLSLNNLPSSSHSQGGQPHQPPRKFSVPSSASSPTVSHGLGGRHGHGSLGFDLGIGGGEMGTGLRPPSPCLSLPTRIGMGINSAASGSPVSPTGTTMTTPSSPLGMEMGVRAQRSRASINGNGHGGSIGNGTGSGTGNGTTTPPKSSSPVLVIGTEAVSLSPISPVVSVSPIHQQQHSYPTAKLQLNTSPSTTTTSSTATETYVSAPASAAFPASAAASEAVSAVSVLSAVSAVSAAMGTADLDSFVLTGSPISPISPVSPVSPLSLDDDDDGHHHHPTKSSETTTRTNTKMGSGMMSF